MSTQLKSSKHPIHPGNAKRMQEALQDFSLTMQHAIRWNMTEELVKRAKEEAGVLPEFTAAEMFDYLADSDPEFYNWCFPFCAVQLTGENLGYLHRYILEQYRKTLIPAEEVVQINDN